MTPKKLNKLGSVSPLERYYPGASCLWAALCTIMAGHLHENLVCLGFPTIGSRGIKEKKGWTHSPCRFFYYLGGKIWDVNIKKP